MEISSDVNVIILILFSSTIMSYNNLFRWRMMMCCCYYYTHTHITTSVLQWVNNTHARTHHLRDGQATHRKRATTLRAFKHRESAIRTTSAMNIWTGPRCIERDVSSFDTERAFKPEALKKRNFHDKENLGRSMRRNNHRPLPTLATLNPNSLFGGITPGKK